MNSVGGDVMCHHGNPPLRLTRTPAASSCAAEDLSPPETTTSAEYRRRAEDYSADAKDDSTIDYVLQTRLSIAEGRRRRSLRFPESLRPPCQLPSPSGVEPSQGDEAPYQGTGFEPEQLGYSASTHSATDDDDDDSEVCRIFSSSYRLSAILSPSITIGGKTTNDRHAYLRPIAGRQEIVGGAEAQVFQGVPERKGAPGYDVTDDSLLRLTAHRPRLDFRKMMVNYNY